MLKEEVPLESNTVGRLIDLTEQSVSAQIEEMSKGVR